MTTTTPSTTANTRSTTTDGTLNSNPCFRSDNNNNNCTTTTTTTTTTRSISYILLLLRGPIIVFAVIISLLFPYIQEYCTVWVFMHVTIAIVGLLWICHDLKIIIESKTRYVLNFLLNKIILDDVLKVIYDPMDGIWACMVGTFVGASTIYGFNMNNEQKIELLQSSFYFLRNKYEAHTVLLEAGGCKKLLPNEVQQWLSTGAGAARTTSTSMSTTINNSNNEEEIQIQINNNNNNNSNATTSIDPYTNNNVPYSPLSPSSYTSDCDVADIDDCDDDDDDDDECRNYLDIFKEEEEEFDDDDDDDDDLITSARELQHQQRTKTAAAAAATTCSSRSKSNSSSNQQTDDNNNNDNDNDNNNNKNDNKNGNIAVFCKILQKMILQKLQPCAESLQQSQSKIENVGITSAMIAIGIQYIAFRQRRQQQRQHQHQHQRSYNNNMILPFPSSSFLGSIFCASIATMSFGTILSKEVILGNIYNKQTMQRSCYDITSRIVNRLKGQAKQIITIPKNKKERFLAAMFVLVLFCHNRRHRQGNHHHTTTQ